MGIAASTFAAAPDELRPAIGRFYAKVYGERARQLGWTAKPGENDDLQSLRIQLVNLVAVAGKDATVVVDNRTMKVVASIPVGYVPKRNTSGMVQTN